jgi:hypothetical protein
MKVFFPAQPAEAKHDSVRVFPTEDSTALRAASLFRPQFSVRLKIQGRFPHLRLLLTRVQPPGAPE